MVQATDSRVGAPVTWGKVIDNRKCIGCHACTVACKQEHQVPLGVDRTYVKQVEVGSFPNVRRHFQVLRCNQCEDAPCVEVCPTSAMFQRPDGIVDFDRSACIGCKSCIAACPYDAIYIDPISHSAEKCNFCTSRIDRGLQPACVVICPTQAIFVGDRDDPESDVSRLIANGSTTVKKPEKLTSPKVFYVDADSSTMVPTAAAFSGTFQSAGPRDGWVAPGGDRQGGPSQSQAAALLTYDGAHRAPWNWIVSAYTWTKSVAAGAVLIGAILGILGYSLDRDWELGVSLVAAAMMAATAALLVADLAHPERFILVLLKTQRRSWVARGAYAITTFSAYVGAMLLALALDLEGLVEVLRWLGITLALATATYTAFLFGQAKGRDLWQDHWSPLRFAVQAAVAGSAALLLLSAVIEPVEGVSVALRWAFIASVGIQLLLTLGHLVMHRATVEGAMAVRNMVRGRFAAYYWGSVALGGVLPLVLVLPSGETGPLVVAGAVGGLIGLLAYEHAYVQSGQSVPLS